MGGTPLFALNLVGWPRDTAPFELLGDVLRGAAEVAERARCLILGGHSIDSVEPLYGMCVIGEVHPDRMLTNGGAGSGDLLVLTKPLGTGILTTALKRDALIETGLTEAVRSMTALNEGASRAALAAGVSAATDVTGFGLLGHLAHMLAASGLAAEIAFDTLPVLDHARNLAARGVVPGGTTRNLAAADGVEWGDDLSQTDRIICVDAQTSGGLLLAVPEERGGAARGPPGGGDARRGDDRPLDRRASRRDPRCPVVVAFIHVTAPLDRPTHGPDRTCRTRRTAGRRHAPGHRVCRRGPPGGHPSGARRH